MLDACLNSLVLYSLQHAPLPAVWSADKEREPVPITGDAERPLPDPWGDVAWRSEG